MFSEISIRQAACALLLASVALHAQKPPAFPSPLDLARDIKPAAHTPLPEEYIWTANDITTLRPDHAKFPWRDQEKRVEKHLFRTSFQLTSVPEHATLYIAGPREADVFLNGQPLAHFASDIDAPIGFRVFHADAAKLLKPGENHIAIKAVRGRGIVSGDPTLINQQITYGEVLVVKLLAAPFGHAGSAMLLSNKNWRSATASDASTAWMQTSFNDSAWKPVASLGPIESDRNLLQWSADAGMYAWPGYMGLSPTLGTYEVRPAAVTHVFSGQSHFEHLEALTTSSSDLPFTVSSPANAQPLTDGESPALLLDFGREIAGRLLVESASDNDAVLSITYGESELEALATGLTSSQRGGNYLGVNLLEVPAQGTARGPKSAFRYVRIRFLRGGRYASFKSIRAEGIAYPVTYAGSFESSDPLLNRIWETGAYTAHLCMQDDLWDAPKRDRGRWAGDIDVEGRVISDVFGDKTLTEQTLAGLVPPEGKAVNGIPGYSALWVTSLASLYAHSGDLEYLHSQRAALLQVVEAMNSSLGPNGIYTIQKGHWPFIDWSPSLYGETPLTLIGTDLTYLRGYSAAATLFDALGDKENAAKTRATGEHLRTSLLETLPQGGNPGRTWQLNALAVQSGFFNTPQAKAAVWRDVLSHVKEDSPEDQTISPYFNTTVLDAMATLGHERAALDWIRTYWGGILAEGATSFWESYDLRWPKDTPHLSLQADGTSGFFVSLAHGWSSGPTAWLSEQVLGVRDPHDGFRTVTIAPRLLGLQWAKGAVPTPHGPIHVSMSMAGAVETIEVEIPAGVERANVAIEASRSGTPVLVDGHAITPSHSENGQQMLPQFGTGKHAIRFTPSNP